VYAAVLVLAIVVAPAQQPPSAASARQSARVDLTGNWVSLVNEEWLYRIVTPPRGDYTAVPLNAEGRKVADNWDIARDEASGEQCKPFGAAGIMRLPTRLRIGWADDNTLKIETDAGQQTRLFHFRQTTPPAEKTWQGHSVAKWSARQGPPPAYGGGGRGRGPAAGLTHGSLEVVTTQLRPGYLRKNGVPYSDRTVLTEYYDRVTAFTSDYLVVTTVVEDPVYMSVPFITTTHFKREADGSKWEPSSCKTDPPTRRGPGG
jgi:hypothetical protein